MLLISFNPGSGSIASPEVKLTLALGTLLLSLMCLAQFVRFSLHLVGGWSPFSGMLMYQHKCPKSTKGAYSHLSWSADVCDERCRLEPGKVPASYQARPGVH